MIFIDTNYFLRFLRADIPAQCEEAKALFRDAAVGKLQLCTSTLVIFEFYWVLTSFYKTDKKEVASALEKILSMNFIRVDERIILESAISFFRKSTFDLEDSYNIAYAKAKGAKEFKTFDKKLQRAL